MQVNAEIKTPLATRVLRQLSRLTTFDMLPRGSKASASRKLWVRLHFILMRDRCVNELGDTSWCTDWCKQATGTDKEWSWCGQAGMGLGRLLLAAAPCGCGFRPRAGAKAMLDVSGHGAGWRAKAVQVKGVGFGAAAARVARHAHQRIGLFEKHVLERDDDALQEGVCDGAAVSSFGRHQSPSRPRWQRPANCTHTAARSLVQQASCGATLLGTGGAFHVGSDAPPARAGGQAARVAGLCLAWKLPWVSSRVMWRM